MPKAKKEEKQATDEISKALESPDAPKLTGEDKKKQEVSEALLGLLSEKNGGAVRLGERLHVATTQITGHLKLSSDAAGGSNETIIILRDDMKLLNLAMKAILTGEVPKI